jgi:segregation and condensation protein A
MTLPNRAEPGNAFVVDLDQFQGPLDLLLNLIRQQEIEITDIPIAKITDQFLKAINTLGLNQAADYLEMAALLLRIKIQMLLPRPLDESDWEDPRAELVRRLLEYEQIKEVVVWIGARAEHRSDRFARGWSPPEPELPPQPLTLDLDGLLKAVEEVIASIPQPVLHRVVVRPLDIQGARDRINLLLGAGGKTTFQEIVAETKTVAFVISTLLVLLEMARQGEVDLAQPQPFGVFEIIRESAD